MAGLSSLTQAQLLNCLQQAKQTALEGRVMDRIPLLSAAQPDWFAVSIRSGSQTYQSGDLDRPFPLMSVIKPFSLLYLLDQFDLETVFQWVGIQPSTAPFNSLDQLMADRGFPRNPMINSGAITLADKLPGSSASDRCQMLCDWLNDYTGSQIYLDEAMLASVRAVGRERNQVLTHTLAQSGRVGDPAVALDTYEHICCLTGRVFDLANLGNLLAYNHDRLKPSHRRIVNALMMTCGLYEASAEFAVRIGLPMKSGISGGLLAIVPHQGVIACYGPALDPVGNSIVGLAFVERLTQVLQLSIF